MKALTFSQLKALIGVKTERDVYAFVSGPEGLPKGAITEIFGVGKTEFVLKFLAEQSEVRVAWVEENFSVYPFGFLQRQVDLGRLLFVESGSETSWCVLQVLKAQVFGVVVVYSENLSLSELRKIQLASEKSQSAVLWLTSRAKELWPVSLQIKVQREDHQIKAQVTRRRY